ncbi:hypothetical protein RFI_19986 [Reticulomyxa filosa]|uniref:Kelch motif family protein n=1 Tax=Reticulomyxa filosa TaxID=46433 RepID=X6MUJ7_RETFI|nr:hypothetical protein RFI_19986 [Reticulomyxa filosa]|eukprot:ETO17336.1 hypothetical protein RFI_19986 [Reticulomyxa filosa]
MGNQNKKQTIITSIPFQNLKDLPIPLDKSQCLLHKQEILICGGNNERACYSYHTLKNEYKFICEYPKNVELFGHCVVKLMDNNKDSNEITLLSFGGCEYAKRHTLIMKYVSVWNNDNKMNQSKKYNQWIPFKDNNNNIIHIGRDEDDYFRVRAVIGGSNNNLLFIAYYPKNISVFDLNTFKWIKHYTFQNNTSCHCFISKLENRQIIMKTNNKNYEMILFSDNIIFSIKYNEDNNNFQCEQIHDCNNIAKFKNCAYVRINDNILFFGGNDGYVISKSIYKYSIHENILTIFDLTLHIPLYNCFGILNEDNTYIHIIGGNNFKRDKISIHMKTKVSDWRNSSQLVIFFFNICIYIYFFFCDQTYIVLKLINSQIMKYNLLFNIGFEF